MIGQLGESSEQALRFEEVEFHREAGFTRISAKDPEALLRSLSRADQGLAAAKTVVLNNLQNQHTTKTASGEPYRRQFPQFRPDGSFRGTVEDGGDFNWIYDPAHPDAMKDGPKAGYVARPAINPIQEQATLDEIAAQRLVLQELLRQVAPNVIFSSVRPFEPWELVETVPPRLSLNELLAMPISDPLELGRPFSSHWGVKQLNSTSSGQASVACALNWLSGDWKYSARTINEKYGFSLLNALKGESLSLGLDWRDAGNFSEEIWPEVEQTLRQRHPVILAFAGTSPSEKVGKVVVLVDFGPDTVRYLDPANCQLIETSREALLEAPTHPDGNFVFLPYPLDQF